MITYLARFYVNILEPGFYILAAIVGIAFVFYLFTIIRGGDPKSGLAGKVINITFVSIKKLLTFIGIAAVKTLTLLLKTIKLIIATMRDFFKSKI